MKVGQGATLIVSASLPLTGGSEPPPPPPPAALRAASFALAFRSRSAAFRSCAVELRDREAEEEEEEDEEGHPPPPAVATLPRPGGGLRGLAAVPLSVRSHDALDAALLLATLE